MSYLVIEGPAAIVLLNKCKNSALEEFSELTEQCRLLDKSMVLHKFLWYTWTANSFERTNQYRILYARLNVCHKVLKLVDRLERATNEGGIREIAISINDYKSITRYL